MEDFDRSPVTNPDVQEALSRKYSNEVILLLPLKSGNVAIFGRDFQLHTITDGSPFEIDDLRALSTELNIKMFQKSKIAEAARFYGEPDDKNLGRDLKTGRREPSPAQRPAKPAAVIFEL